MEHSDDFECKDSPLAKPLTEGIEHRSDIEMQEFFGGEQKVDSAAVDPVNGGDVDKTIYEFIIEGMTCVACSGSIENGIKIAFEGKGLISCAVILLTHKM
jgi:hypothetical protein